jgi:hypothetical protein
MCGMRVNFDLVLFFCFCSVILFFFKITPSGESGFAATTVSTTATAVPFTASRRLVPSHRLETILLVALSCFFLIFAQMKPYYEGESGDGDDGDEYAEEARRERGREGGW